MISVVENKDFIVTKTLDVVRNNPNISQKEVVSLVTEIFGNISDEDKTFILQTLNNLVQNKVIRRITKGRKVTYVFNEDDTDENVEEVDTERVNTKKVKQEVNKFILKNLTEGDVNRNKLTEITLKEIGISDDDRLDTSTESKFTLYKGIIGTVLAELNKSGVIALSGSKNKQVVSLVKKEEKNKKEKKVSKKEEKKANKNIKKEVKSSSKEERLKEVLETYDNLISNNLDTMKLEQARIQKEFNERQKENILKFICNSKAAHDSSISEAIASHVICKLYGVDESNAQIQGGPNDGGIDAVVTVKEPLGFPTKRVAIQMKCYENPDKGCTPNEITKFYGDMARLGFRKGFMITTGIFDERAINKQFTDTQGTYVHVAKYHKLEFDFGTHQRMIICFDGKTLVDYMIEFGIGVLVSEEGNIVGIDREYFDKLSEK